MFDLKTLEYDKVLKLILPYCNTREAREALLNLSPSSDYDEVNKLIEETYEASRILVKHGKLPFSNYGDISNYLSIVNKGGNLDELELLNIMIFINTSLAISKYLSNIFDSSKEVYKELNIHVSNLINLSKLRNLLSLAISNEGKVLDQASKNLFQIRRKLNLIDNKLRQELNQIMARNSHKLQELLIVVRDNRLCLPVKIEYKNSFRGILHDISSSNNTCYIEPEETFLIANEFESLKEEERIEINKILAELSLLVKADSESLKNNLDILTYLDLVFAKAEYSKEYLKPKLSTDFSFNLRDVCHPLINKDEVVPISIYMKKEDQVIIVTGPNTGGKTVALKTVGLLSLLVQSGIFPNSKKESSYFVFKNICADIGDEQSIEESLSTFSSHITKINSILANDLNDSLILLDELGSGTDPKEGSALAISLIEYIKENKTKAIITTHYTDLKNYAYKTSGVVNASVEFNSKTLAATYKILIGIPGSSNALDIANNLGLPFGVINRAREILADEPLNYDIVEFENKMQELNSKLVEVDNIKEMLNSKERELDLAKSLIEQDREKLLIKAKKDADLIIEKAKIDSNNLLKEIKELRSNIDIKDHLIADAKNRVNTLSSEDIDTKVFDEELNVGDFVKIIPYNQVGKILSINKNRYKVNFSQFTMDFSKKDLVKTKVEETKEIKKTKLTGYNQVNGATMSLDLRGKRYEEVKDLVDDFIDKAVLANYESVSIIHGFGTGVVRKRVRELLDKNPSVKSFRYGGEGEGLNGVTVVMLK